MRKRHFLLMVVCLTQLVLTQGLQAQDGSELLNELGLQKADLTVQRATYERQITNPISQLAQNELRSTSGVSDVVGTLSIEDFPTGIAGDLSYTHDSADGFRTYLEQWHKTNYIYRDAGVGAWQYRDIAGGDNWDFWTSNGTDFGIDAVLTCWHSGHGGMSSNVYTIPLGADWSGRGYYASSNQMFLGGNNYSYGDERLRYMFWDTCDSVKVDGGNDPYSTWGVRAKGVRMVFGYNTVSVDNANYGKYFWEEWNKNKSLSYAFLDASWRISTSQSPCVVAFGSTEAEAINIRDTERMLYWNSISNAWGAWRWYYARTLAKKPEITDADLLQASAYQVSNNSNTYAEIKKVAQTLGIELQDQKSLESLPYGLKKLAMNGASLFVESNGNFELTINKKASAMRDAAEIADSELLAKAEKIVSQLSMMKGKQYQVGMIRNTNSGTRSANQAVRSTVIEKTVIFDQMLDKLSFVDAEKGHLEIRFDARTGQVLQLKSSMVETASIVTRSSSDKERLTIAAARKQALAKYEQSQKIYSRKAESKAVLESEAVGYQVINGVAQPVYQATFSISGVKYARPAQVMIPLLGSK